MADQAHITRRSALVGAAAVAASVSVIPPALARVYRTGAKDVDTQLKVLADQFYQDAKLIDPTITGAWFGYDHDPKLEGRDPLFTLIFERGESEALRRSRAMRDKARA